MSIQLRDRALPEVKVNESAKFLKDFKRKMKNPEGIVYANRQQTIEPFPAPIGLAYALRVQYGDNDGDTVKR